MKDHEVAVWAEEFWRRVGRSEPFPRSLEPSISWALPAVLVKLPRLGLAQVGQWLEGKNIPFRCSTRDRYLEACLIARGGYGLIFLDGGDPPDVQRFALAHEIGHFLIDYLEPRQRALECLGERVRDVLDGRRVPTTEERLSGVLRGASLGAFTHLMERGAAGDVERVRVLAAEDRADRLALELLAPRQVVLDRLEALAVRWGEREIAAEEILVQEFGLPVVAARAYGRMIVMYRQTPRSFQEWIQPRRVEVPGADGKR